MLFMTLQAADVLIAAMPVSLASAARRDLRAMAQAVLIAAVPV
jgi:hypothetical protein